jgi:hypothetical protein
MKSHPFEIAVLETVLETCDATASGGAARLWLEALSEGGCPEPF